MDQILQSLVSATTPVSTSSETPSASNMQLTEEDHENIDDVMKVLANQMGDLNDQDVADTLTTVQDVSQVVDKATLADEKIAKLSERQKELEHRFANLNQRINHLRLRHMGNHIVDELTSLRSICEKAAPPQPKPALPKLNFNLIQTPTTLPEGVMLPSVPCAEVAPPTPSTPMSAPPILSFKVKEEAEDHSTSTSEAPMNTDDKERTDEVLGQMEANLNHLMKEYDSEATESSSGGESCDELDNFSSQNVEFAPIKSRAKWQWLSSRARTASKWTWLTAQIADLEYRIRQQTEFYRQIRAAKGPVTLFEPQPSAPGIPTLPVTLGGAPVVIEPPPKEFSRVDSLGRKIIIREPSPNTSGSESESTFTSSRTRAVKQVRRRRILATKGIYRSNARAAKESTVRCDCIHPLYSCAICFGRTNHTQVPDPVSQERGHTISLLDHSYHQVLSRKEDVPVDLHFMQKIKNRSWLVNQNNLNGQLMQSKADDKKRKYKKKKKEEEGLKRKGKKMDGGRMRKRLKSDRRRKSVTVTRADGPAVHDAMGDEDSNSLPSPSVANLTGGDTRAWADHIRRKRGTDFDIDNIVIPYSIAAATRVERLKYKEITVPNWRTVEEEAEGTAADEEEDITEHNYIARHLKAEVEEKRRWQTPFKLTGGQRGAQRRKDMSGYNTPTDPLSPGMVERVDTLEVNTRPSSPSDEAAAASIRNRRRTSSTTKSRDRNPSEDTQSSRCTTPSGACAVEQEEVAPFEPRKFPIADDDYEVMIADMPTGHQYPPEPEPAPPAKPTPVASTSMEVPSSSRSSSVTDDSEDWNPDDPDDPEWTGSGRDESGAKGKKSTASSGSSGSKK